jgi:glucose/arabinose dehydrogenase
MPMPILTDNNSSFSIEPISAGLNFPTSMAFLSSDDILVLEKNQGVVKRIVNGNLLQDPLLDVNVGNKAERGMLGIDISEKNTDGNTKPIIYVFLYYTETKLKDGEDVTSTRLADIPGQGPLGNRLYRYELVNNKLVNAKLLIDLPAEPRGNHQGGVVQIGPDDNVYVIIGDVDHFTQAQNYKDGNESDGTGGILRVTQDGKQVGKGILGNKHPLNLYYAYGIRNSFGMDFDPVTGNLWDTENGLRCCDEINLVEEGFNSGWDKVQGFWKTNHSQKRDRDGKFDEKSSKELVTFDGNGKYSSPEFVWNRTIAPTAMKFFNSTKFGQEFKDDLFVGSANDQNLYHFDLTKDRTELILSGSLADLVVDSSDNIESIVFAKNFGRITDLEVGPDGNLYVLSHQGGGDMNFKNGAIFKMSKVGN